MVRQAHEADDEGGPVGDGRGVQCACVLAEFERAGFACWVGVLAGWVERRGEERRGREREGGGGYRLSARYRSS